MPDHAAREDDDDSAATCERQAALEDSSGSVGRPGSQEAAEKSAALSENKTTDKSVADKSGATERTQIFTGGRMSVKPRLSQTAHSGLLDGLQKMGGGATGAAANMEVNMFADADAMRDKIHENIDKRDYDVTDYYSETGISQAIARSAIFGAFTLAVIAVNAVWIGLDAECNNTDARDISYCPFEHHDTAFWMAGEQSFCAFFTFELLVRFGAFQIKRSALRDNWFKFDALLVFFMVFETWLLPIVTGGNGDALSDFALLRMLRLLRLTRMVRLMRSVPELVTLLKGMVIACCSVSYTLVLLIMFMYIFSIVFKSQLVDTEVSALKKHFNGIPRSMWTLLLSGCFLDDISTIANLLMQEGAIITFIFIFFVLLSSLMVLNMLIGVLCAVVTAVAAAEKEKALVGYVKAKLIIVLESLDQDGSGALSKNEFDALMEIPQAVNALEELGVDVPNLLSLSDHLFEQEDSDDRKTRNNSKCGQLEDKESGPTMTFAEFLEMVIRLRSDNPPSVADIVDLRKLMFRNQRQVTKRLNHIEKGQYQLEQNIKRICEQLDSALALQQKWRGKTTKQSQQERLQHAADRSEHGKASVADRSEQDKSSGEQSVACEENGRDYL